MLLIIFLVTFLFYISNATYGVDLSQPCTTSGFSCLKSSYSDAFMISRAWYSYGSYDSGGCTNLRNAQAAGIEYTDVYMFPCRGKSAATQVDDLIADLNGCSAKYGMIWFDIEINPSSGCSWASYSASSNCQYLQELISAAQAKGKSVGVYSSEYEWTTVMGSRYACAVSAVKSLPLWYAHYDNSASFSDFGSVAFGGWSKPAIKQYDGSTTHCGCGVDLNYY